MGIKRTRTCKTCGAVYYGYGRYYCSCKCRAGDKDLQASRSQKLKGRVSPRKGQPHPLGTAAADPLRKWQSQNTTGKKYVERNCDTCGAFYRGRGKKYCSNKCRSENQEWRSVNSASKKGRVPWNKGKSYPHHPNSINALKEWSANNPPWNKGTKGVMRRNAGSFITERVQGAANVNWKGGITPEHQKIRKSKEYAEWRKAVFERDHFTCVICGYRSSYNYRRGDKCDIRADHIKPFCLFPELRLDISNGRTLCIPCDRKHGWNSLREMNDDINYGKIK